jgi:hypothetical protein
VSAIVVLLIVGLWKERRFCAAVAGCALNSSAGCGFYTTLWGTTGLSRAVR